MRRKPILALAAASAMLVPAAVMTSSASAAVSQSTSKYFLKGGMSPVKGVKVSGYDGKTVYFAVTTNRGAAGFVSVNSTAGLSLAFGYPSFSGSSIAFTGSQDAVNAALTTLAVGATDSTTSVQVQMTAFDNGNGLAFNPANQHFYKYVPIGPCAINTDSGCTTAEQTARNPDTAKAAAEATTELGLTGYLASITSAEENNFISSKIQYATAVIIGGRDADEEGTWKWVGGPDNGTAFWRGCAANAASPGAALGYASWSTGEPNNYISSTDKCGAGAQTGAGEDCTVTNWTDNSAAEQSGYWNDVPCGNNAYTARRVRGYVAEFGNKPAGGDFAGVDFVTSTMTVAVPATKPTFLDTLFNLIGFNKKTLKKGFKFTVKKPKAKPQTITCPKVKRLRFSYTLLFTEAGRYSFYFTNSKGKRVPMECGTKIKDRVITGPISAPVIQSVKDNEKPVITAYLDVAALKDTADYPLLNVILKRKDGTLVRQDQPNPPLAGTPIR